MFLDDNVFACKVKVHAFLANQLWSCPIQVYLFAGDGVQLQISKLALGETRESYLNVKQHINI